MTLLTPNMFRRPEEPKIEDYKGNLMIRGGQIDNMEQFQKDHDHWKFITGPKPEPYYYKFSEVEPKPYQHIIVGGVHNTWYRSEEEDDEKYFKGYPHPLIAREPEYRPKNTFRKWADQDVYDATLKRWKDNQIRFPGWEVVTESKTGITLSKENLRLQFFTTDKEIHLTEINKGAIYSGPCDVDLFEKLLEIKERFKTNTLFQFQYGTIERR